MSQMEKLLEEIIYSPTKSNAKKPITRLRSLASQIRPNINSYAAEKLSQAIGYADSASGCIDKKEHWANNANQAWYLFEREVDFKEE